MSNVKRYWNMWGELHELDGNKVGEYLSHGGPEVLIAESDHLATIAELTRERDELREKLAKLESPKLDMSKRKTVQPKDVLGMVRLGIKPVLVCNKSIEDMGIDSPWELGMYARVKSIAISSMGDDGFEIVLDLSEFSDINDGMAGSDWHMKGGNGMGTCKQAGWWKPEDTLWVPVENFDLEMVEAPL